MLAIDNRKTTADLEPTLKKKICWPAYATVEHPSENQSIYLSINRSSNQSSPFQSKSEFQSKSKSNPKSPDPPDRPNTIHSNPSSTNPLFESLEESMHRKMSWRLALAEKWKAKREMYMSLYIMYRSQIYCFIVDVNLPLLMFEFNYNNDLTGILIYLLSRKILEIALRKRLK